MDKQTGLLVNHAYGLVDIKVDGHRTRSITRLQYISLSDISRCHLPRTGDIPVALTAHVVLAMLQVEMLVAAAVTSTRSRPVGIDWMGKRRHPRGRVMMAIHGVE